MLRIQVEFDAFMRGLFCVLKELQKYYIFAQNEYFEYVKQSALCIRITVRGNRRYIRHIS